MFSGLAPLKSVSASFSMPCRIFLRCYAALWYVAQPILRRNKRMADGFAKRLVPEQWCETVDVWIQAASGGEAYLAIQLLETWSEIYTQKKDIRILLTSCTRQGVDILKKARERNFAHLNIQVQFFPLDTPHAMQKALQQSQTRLLVLLETELWPALLAECKKENVPVLVLNGRMSKKSMRSYALFPRLWQELAPKEVFAISQEDAQRFGHIFKHTAIHTMHNIKFDRIPLIQEQQQRNRTKEPSILKKILPQTPVPLIVLGSIRKQELPAMQEIIYALLLARQDIAIVLAPRHLHYAEKFQHMAEKARKAVQAQHSGHSLPPVTVRSKLVAQKQSMQAGQVVVWDSFGELTSLYTHASAVFVGGSLVPLGGQNFLEVLEHGIRPCIGPHWENFAWIGKEIVQTGLAQEAATPGTVVTLLLQQLATPASRTEIQQRFHEYILTKKGGSIKAIHALQEYLFIQDK